jgi:hypothetical protein
LGVLENDLNIPKKCRECKDKTVTRKREHLCSQYHKVLTEVRTPFCEQPQNMTTEAIKAKVAEGNKEIADYEKLIREAKDDFRREEAIVEMRKKAIRETNDDLDKYKRALRRRERAVTLSNDDMRYLEVKIKSIVFHERGKKRWVDIWFTCPGAKEIPDFGRRVVNHSEGHSSLEGIGYPKTSEGVFKMYDYLKAVDRVIDDLHEVFNPWLLCEKEGN